MQIKIVFGLKKLHSWFGTAPTSPELPTQIHTIPAATDVVAAAKSDIGKVRLVNEDNVVFSRPATFREFQKRGAVALVADGMGGAQGGSLASEIAARVIPESYFAEEDEPVAALRRALLAANKEIFQRAGRDKDLKGMGTTCVALVLSPSFAWAAWAGDSRLYLIRNDQIFQMTEDHSLVNEMVRRGMITSEQAANHEDRNVVTRVLGSHAKVEPSVWEKPYPVQVGDRFVLCSDGIHDPLSQPEILQIARNGSVDDAAARLISAANEKGGFDNASAVVVELVDRSATHVVRPTRESQALDETRS